MSFKEKLNELWINSLQKKMRQLIQIYKKACCKDKGNNLFSYVYDRQD